MLQISEIQASNITLNSKRGLLELRGCVCSVKCHFTEIDDFEVIFWKNFATSDAIICAIRDGEVVVLATSAGIAETEQT